MESRRRERPPRDGALAHSGGLVFQLLCAFVEQGELGLGLVGLEGRVGGVVVEGGEGLRGGVGGLLVGIV